MGKLVIFFILFFIFIFIFYFLFLLFYFILSLFNLIYFIFLFFIYFISLYLDEASHEVVLANNTAFGCSRRAVSVHSCRDQIIDGNLLMDFRTYGLDFNYEPDNPFPIINNTLRNNLFLTDSTSARYKTNIFTFFFLTLITKYIS